MPVALYTPRVNNNDDTVRLTSRLVAPGSYVNQGDPVADVETDKATFTVEADRPGYLLAFTFETGETITVGSVLAWIGESADEAVPEASGPSAGAAAKPTTAAPTLKAAILLAQFGLAAHEVPASGDRLAASDVESYIRTHGLQPGRRQAGSGSAAVRPVTPAPGPAEPGMTVRLEPAAHGMLRTVAWHRSEAVPGYLELSWDAAPWAEYAETFQKQHGLFLNPLLALLAWRLVRAAADQPLLNSTIFTEQSWQYNHVNLGFTVQAGASLMVVVVREAEAMEAPVFVKRLVDLQRRALRNSLRPEEAAGATIGFSSMARWPVTRHVPVLLPHTAIMVAHTGGLGQNASIGATYDHRVLHGDNVVSALRAVTAAPAETGKVSP